jgi:methionyl-tRNA formyltransferase
MVNLHGGLSPEYRGADCTFWALHNAEPEKIACTLHYIDTGIDTGRLIAHVSPEVRSDDDELTLFWRGVKESARVYAELMQRLAQGEALGVVQHDKGRLYQVRQRGLRQELTVEHRLRDGLLCDLDLGPRVRWFPADHRSKQTRMRSPSGGRGS